MNTKYREIFSTQGANPLSKLGIKTPKLVQKVFDDDVKSFVIGVQGSSFHVSHVSLPLEPKAMIKLTDPILVLQMNISKTGLTHIELQITSFSIETRSKRALRLIISSNIKQLNRTELHTQIPFSFSMEENYSTDVQQGSGWYNVMINLLQLDPGYLSLERIGIGPQCRIRRVWTMKSDVSFSELPPIYTRGVHQMIRIPNETSTPDRQSCGSNDTNDEIAAQDSIEKCTSSGVHVAFGRRVYSLNSECNRSKEKRPLTSIPRTTVPKTDLLARKIKTSAGLRSAKIQSQSTLNPSPSPRTNVPILETKMFNDTNSTVNSRRVSKRSLSKTNELPDPERNEDIEAEKKSVVRFHSPVGLSTTKIKTDNMLHEPVVRSKNLPINTEKETEVNILYHTRPSQYLYYSQEAMVSEAPSHFSILSKEEVSSSYPDNHYLAPEDDDAVNIDQEDEISDDEMVQIQSMNLSGDGDEYITQTEEQHVEEREEFDDYPHFSNDSTRHISKSPIISSSLRRSSHLDFTMDSDSDSSNSELYDDDTQNEYNRSRFHVQSFKEQAIEEDETDDEEEDFHTDDERQAEADDDNEVDLIYDPMLNLYFDPRTGKYYAAKH